MFFLSSNLLLLLFPNQLSFFFPPPSEIHALKPELKHTHLSSLNSISKLSY